jgi:2,3-dihydroxyphenylpropionate 1,2-dioxygenase
LPARRFSGRCYRDALVGYTDEETYLNAGQGGFEIRTFIAVAGAAEGSIGALYVYQPIPIFAVGCPVARMGGGGL